MKILWLANSPCVAAKILNKDVYFGGWIVSLEQQIKLNQAIDLSVCFYYNGEVSPFEYNSVNY